MAKHGLITQAQCQLCPNRLPHSTVPRDPEGAQASLLPGLGCTLELLFPMNVPCFGLWLYLAF